MERARTTRSEEQHQDLAVGGRPLSSHGRDKQAAGTKAASVKCLGKFTMWRRVATKVRSAGDFLDSVFSLKLDADMWQVAKVAQILPSFVPTPIQSVAPPTRQRLFLCDILHRQDRDKPDTGAGKGLAFSLLWES